MSSQASSPSHGSSAAAPRRDDRGASAVEYGLLISGIAALIVLIVYAFGAEIDSLFQNTCDAIEVQRGAAGC